MNLQKFLGNLPFLNKHKQEAERVLEAAKLKAKELEIKAKEEALELKRESERSLRRSKQDVHDSERRLQMREAEVTNLKKQLENQRDQVAQLQKTLTEKKEEILQKLEKVAQLNQKDAKELIMKGWEDKLKGDVAKNIKQAEEKTKAEADKKAREILVDAMRHGGTDYIAEYTLSTVPLDDDSVKGRIIGKEGRNIRAFELATGVDVDLEEEGVIKISSFDALKREIAKTALERLVKDGRIQPVRIEEVVEQTRKDLERIMMKAGEDLVHRVGVYDLPPELVALLGRFKYRYSYGQNMILHTLEETKIGIALAHELKADVMTVKLGCLFHF
jgi:ribonuclease Y